MQQERHVKLLHSLFNAFHGKREILHDEMEHLDMQGTRRMTDRLLRILDQNIDNGNETFVASHSPAKIEGTHRKAGLVSCTMSPTRGR